VIALHTQAHILGACVQSASRLAATALLASALHAAPLAALGGAALAGLVSVPAAATETGATPREITTRKSAAKKKSGPTAETPFGREGDPRKAKRVIHIEMSDAMRYFPDQIRVKKGQTVRFVVRNGGQAPHEMVLGTMDDLKKHAAMMKKNEERDHDDASNIAHVEPGGTGRIVWQFTKAGEFYYGCLVPGHFEAGMIGTVVVR
jgi:uncharacterized cupredoxin-like copper-binding protein